MHIADKFLANPAALNCHFSTRVGRREVSKLLEHGELREMIKRAGGFTSDQVGSIHIPEGAQVAIIGSVVVPGAKAGDVDVLIYIPDDTAAATFTGLASESLGFKSCAGSAYPGTFSAWRLGDLNLIITSDHDFFFSSRLAAKLTHELDVSGKSARVATYEIIREWVATLHSTRQSSP